MPYLALMDRLRSFLRQPNALLIACGFSFRDQHINEVIIETLQGNASAMVFALMRSEISKYPEAARAAARRSNLSVLAADAAIIGTKQAPWREIVGEVPLTTSAIEWIASSTSTEDQRKRAHFLLGDFGKLGEFLEDIIGLEASKSYGLNAE